MRVLFVDDDSNVLHALRRALHSMKSEWHMEFVESGNKAMESLAVTPADVIVSDLRMPGMDGCELLAEVKRLYPETVRLVLSGFAELGSVMRLIGIAHQYIAKPGESGLIKAAIAQTLLMKELLANKELALLAGSVGTLPSFPKTFQEISSCLKQPNSTVADAARIISRDVAMTANIMKMVNSAFFGARRPVSTVDRAVALLGLDTLTTLVLGYGLFQSADSDPIESLWPHSFKTAVIARTIALTEHLPAARVEEAFLTGMLHDVGRVVLATRAAKTGKSIQDEDDDHAKVGGYLLGLWGFPSQIVAAVALHHAPSQRPDISVGLDLTVTIHVANVVAQWGASVPGQPEDLGIESGLLEKRGLSSHLPQWLAAITALELDQQTS